MIDRRRLLSGLQGLVRQLEKDLLERSDLPEQLPQIKQTLEQEYAEAQKAERTAQSYGEWREAYGTQVAVAWVLGAVFVRFLEDNRLIESPKLSGPGENLQRARDQHELFFRAHPTETDREYLLAVFRELGELPGMGPIFVDQNPIFALPNWLSGDGAGALLQFFQQIDAATGELVDDFTDENLDKPGIAFDTRFLGDLYQDLSEAARKRYALLQTPNFVEAFILDRTLDPAIEEFGLRGFRMIDPACGSGHFLLGAFDRILDRWQRLEPGTNVRALAQRALDAVHGVDVNPYAVAIARFRLLLAAMRVSGIEKLKNAPGFKFKVACGDSLLHGEGSQLVLGDWAPMAHHFQSEDIGALNEILRAGHYHAVVANPPYITPKDRSLNKLYRQRYETCHMKYSLAVPFLERIFQLAVPGGFTGQITANSFMKREFGKKLIEQFFQKIDLTHVIDTSGAYIPGHGTPTVILFGRNRTPTTSVIRTVMGIRGEPSTPEDAARGLVWSAILKQVDLEGSESEFVSAMDSQRDLFYRHPWSIGGGGAAELKEIIEASSPQHLGDISTSIGFASFPGLDDAFVMSLSSLCRYKIPVRFIKNFVYGEAIRDFSIFSAEYALSPYDENFDLNPFEVEEAWANYLWKVRTSLESIVSFGGKTRKEQGDDWWGWYRWIPEKYRVTNSIAFAFVATHNHFVLDLGGKVFKQSAPVIKLPTGATEDEHLALLGLLNSSTACFWMKQVFHDKGGGGIGGGLASEGWEHFFEYEGTKSKQFPLTADYPTEFARKLDYLASQISNLTPEKALEEFKTSGDLRIDSLLDKNRKAQNDIFSLAVSWQEELDWECYKLYGLIEEDFTYEGSSIPLQLGQRAFEIVMARKVEVGQLNTTWFDRHNSTPITELPADWSEDYKQLIERRIHLIETDKNIRLIEQPEYKRRWHTEPWDSQLQRALETWLLNRIESHFDFDGRMNDDGTPTAHLTNPNLTDPTLISTAKLADIASQDPDFLQVGELYRNDPAFNIQTLIDDLIDKQTVPLLPSLRYKPPGLRKRQDWEHTWQLQRQEDAIDARTTLPKDDPNHLDITAAKRLKETEIGTIPVPPKYATKDFAKGHYWTLRGKLDVPKERWVSFPHCEGPDGLPVIAWAGYDHLQLTSAIATYYMRVKEEFGGSEDPKLVPLLGCLLELLPWVKQWHNDPDPNFDGLKMGDYYDGFINDEAHQLGLTAKEILAWEPQKKKPKRKRKK
ncbi:BREX-2 system adenine-specific DNA-methyltransferase PglX [Leptothoe sp. PORK10 BA2]|uniref:BREX-2 system adenine-specific DNA-methyltransferase PglX n=1 Tax=Leptothoe sp. PORK10 BA2 TaxID=3110254 RepID=UPI002B20F387|nr:BREX-2 system adenine-specific DNA-methyltransferase PglX [Leptothoe sp. PORK10 BA2]MEA5465556.1 BREX-2 system adenine-specific DNA-methyltransferase PglX [Leptothoe sp. PORK10 BA2]